MSTHTHARAKVAPKPSLVPAQGDLLQRRPGNLTTPPTAKEAATLRQPPDLAPHCSAQPNLGHNFSQVRVSSTTPGTIQTKLAVGQPGDRCEREADQAADAVVGMSETPTSLAGGVFPPVRPIQGASPETQPILHRQEIEGEREEEEEKEEEEETLQAKATPGRTLAVTPDLQNDISSALGQGRSLPDSVRAFFEPRFGYDFSRVQVHADARAATLTQRLNARAFTRGRDIFFATGHYRPDTEAGQRLLAHELTHTIQQNGNGTPPASTLGQPRGAVASQDHPLEQEVGSVVERVTGGEQTSAPAILSALPGAAGLILRQVATPEVATVPVPQLTKRSEPLTSLGSIDSEGTEDSAQVSASGEDVQQVSTSQPRQDEPAQDEPTHIEPAQDDPTQGAGAQAIESESGVPEAAEEQGEAAQEAGPAQESDAGALPSSDLAFIDEELAEHQRWAGALGRVDQAGSLGRAEFIAESAGGGVLTGLATGAAMGVGMGLVGRAAARFVPIPGVGSILGGAASVYGLASRDWSATGATISRFGEGRSNYEILANNIATVSETVDIVSNVLNVIAGIIGIISAAMWVISILTLGVASPLAATLSAIALGIGVASGIMDGINAAVLQPCILLFRALHAFTSEADPREVAAQGAELSQAAGASGAALGGFAGGKAAGIGGRPRVPSEDVQPPRPDAANPQLEAPRPAASEGPVVRFEAPPSGVVDAGGAPIPRAESGVVSPSVAPTTATTTSPTSTGGGPSGRPELMNVWSYGTPVPDRASVGHNVQRDHPIQVSLRREQRTSPSGQEHYNRSVSAQRGELTVLAETGRGYFHTEVGRLQAEINQKVRAGTIKSESELIEATREAYRAAAKATGVEVNPAALDKAIVSNLGTLSEPARQTATELRALGVRPQDFPDDAAFDRAFSDPNAQSSPSMKASEPSSSVIVDEAALGLPPGSVVQTGPRIREPSIIVDEAAVGLPPGSVVQVPSPRTDVDWRRLSPLPITDPNHPLRKLSPSQGRNYEPLPPGVEGPVRPPGSHGYEGALGIPDYTTTVRQPDGTILQLPPEFKPEAYFDVTPPEGAWGVRAGPGGSYLDHVFSTAAEADAYARQTAALGETRIREQSALPRGWPPDEKGVVSTGNPVDIMGVHPLPGNMPYLRSAVAPQPESAPTPGLPAMYPGGGPQAQIPGGTLTRGSTPLTRHAVPRGDLGDGVPMADTPRGPYRAQYTVGRRPITGVERVNPNYPEPPGTPQQIAAIQDQIVNLLAARAQAEQAETQMTAQEQRHQANQAPLEEAVQETAGAIPAAQAHQGAVARREQANLEQQQRQQEAQGLIAGYPSRAAGLAALSVPLAGFERFTRYASVLPGDVGRAMIRMNNDATKLQQAFAQMAATMVSQNEAQSARRQELQGDQEHLQQINEQAQTSEQDLQLANEGVEGLQQENERRLGQATEARVEAADQKAELDEAVSVRQQQTRDLAEQLRVWANEHKAAREAAIQVTRQRLQAQGYIVREE
jgi:hypothetical protein